MGQRFATDLHELLHKLRSTETHYIRCMKPNLQMRPRTFDANYVRSRLRAAGSLAALRFAKKLMVSGDASIEARLRCG